MRPRRISHVVAVLGGSDYSLDDNQLMRIAGRLSRRDRRWAQKEHFPVIDCVAGEPKHEQPETKLPAVPQRTGIFLVLVNRALAPFWDLRRCGNGGFELRRKKPMAYVYHYTFHIWDAEWVKVAIRMCGHPLYSGAFMLNGLE